MKLDKKKTLAAKVLRVGEGRIIFVTERLSEIKEAITRQDISDLYKSGAIKIRDVKGRAKIEKRKYRRGVGNRRMVVNDRKEQYVIITRKLRRVLKNLLKINKINREKYKKARSMIRAKKFKSKRHLIESLSEI
jgi:large subunit ribosomal protein L19e